ncbi:unnamed protein product [Allacma fusca]|uniref:F-box domain-containing protein n=1 Tax=Allacma fusca TaxID=39272 RepID=A0A8J2JV41_9HEXA|nr:unnamed protein product [Allacma fusca]
MDCLEEEFEMSVTDVAMSIQLIAETIFGHLSFFDVQNCALVSKTWNFHARNFCKYEAVITESDSCSQLSELNNLLETSVNVPFDVYLFKVSSCPTVACIQTILSEVSFNLKKLNLFVFPTSITSLKQFVNVSVEKCDWLRNLKSISIPSFEGEDRMSVSNLREILVAAPNLQILRGSVSPAYLEVILENNKAAIVTDFDFDPNATQFLKSSQCFARSAPSLEKLRIGTVSEIVEIHIPVELIEVMKLLLLASYTTLKELRIDHFNLFLYTRLGIPPLKQVNKMSITYEDVGQGIVNLRRVDFGLLFPCLETVEIRYDDLSNIDVQIPGDFQRLVCNTVKFFKLSVGNRELNLNPVDNFSKIFPNVEHFYCSSCLDLRDICIYLWTAWSSLESITFTDLASHHIPNLDWLFCGIFEAEAIHLLKFNGQLKDYNLVPSFPSILNCRKLKKLRVEIKHFGRDCEVNRFFPSFLSKTTGHLIFSRLPELQVEINFRTCCRQVPCGYSLDHLKSFAKIGEFEDPETLVILKTFQSQAEVRPTVLLTRTLWLYTPVFERLKSCKQWNSWRISSPPSLLGRS